MTDDGKMTYFALLILVVVVVLSFRDLFDYFKLKKIFELVTGGLLLGVKNCLHRLLVYIGKFSVFWCLSLILGRQCLQSPPPLQACMNY